MLFFGRFARLTTVCNCRISGTRPYTAPFAASRFLKPVAAMAKPPSAGALASGNPLFHLFTDKKYRLK